MHIYVYMYVRMYIYIYRRVHMWYNLDLLLVVSIPKSLLSSYQPVISFPLLSWKDRKLGISSTIYICIYYIYICI